MEEMIERRIELAGGEDVNEPAEVGDRLAVFVRLRPSSVSILGK